MSGERMAERVQGRWPRGITDQVLATGQFKPRGQVITELGANPDGRARAGSAVRLTARQRGIGTAWQNAPAGERRMRWSSARARTG
jgi:hypothetical protein